MIKQKFQKEVTNFAMSCVGQQEIKGNQGFHNKWFDNIMKQVGHLPGEAWCALFCEACWLYPTWPGKSRYMESMRGLFSKSAVQCYYNFKEDDKYVVGQLPEPGSVAIWQNYRDGKKHWTGHAGIVIDVSGNYFTSVEGNTNDDGGREGYEVALKTRQLDFVPKYDGLVLKGFIMIKE